MSHYKDIQIALDTRLDSLAGSLPIAWENTGYKPVKGTEYLRPTTIMSPSLLMDLGNLHQWNAGIYQIDAFYPLENGSGDLLTKLDAIYDHFKGDLDLTSNGVTVHIKEISRTSPAIVDQAWFMASLEVHFRCYEN